MHNFSIYLFLVRKIMQKWVTILTHPHRITKKKGDKRVDKYDTGPVLPRFHGDQHREQIALLMVIEGEDIADLPLLIGYPAKVYLLKAVNALEASDAPRFVQKIQKEGLYREMVQRFRKRKKDVD